ncbi:hypothetical protein HanHA300_Chr17g0658671 [Helianthus annuus]|nr:hypothetical protein HanHA300_Chr17g0658671 [Helianthus annuus]KAJ0447939.1 hypothetical protein HanHA89_Chr17g0711061 [Helianthus annuus]
MNNMLNSYTLEQYSLLLNKQSTVKQSWIDDKNDSQTDVIYKGLVCRICCICFVNKKRLKRGSQSRLRQKKIRRRGLKP